MEKETKPLPPSPPVPPNTRDFVETPYIPKKMGDKR